MYLALRKVKGCWDFGGMTITNLKMGGINKKKESVEQVTANLENFHHNIFDVETFPIDFHR